MNNVKECKIKTEYNVKVYVGNYDKEEFYSIMGKYFAERCYRKKLPYLINDNDKIWYLVYQKEEFLGFFGVKICFDGTLISDIYINDNNDKKSVFKYMAEYLVSIYCDESMKVLTMFKEEQDIWKQLNFKTSGKKGNYSVMVRGKHI